jgi:hypothetical protein
MRLGVIPAQLFAATPDFVAVAGKPRWSQIKTYDFQYVQAKIVRKEQITLNRGYVAGLADGASVDI